MDIWHFNAQESQQLIELKQLPEIGYIWLDCESSELQQLNILLEQLTGTVLHDSHIEDCLNSSHPCAYDTTTHYDILIFHSLISQDINQIKTLPAVFILFNKLLVTVNHSDYHLSRLQNRLQTNRKRLPSSPRSLAYFILNIITDQFLELRKPFSEYLLALQNKLLNADKPFRDWNKLFDFKANIRNFGMVCEDQHDAIERWRQDLALVTNDPFMVRLNDLLNHSLRASRHSRMIENELETLVELHYSVVNHRTNEIMRTLTVIAGIFLPLSFITGFFGMNFDNMTILHSPYGYYGSLIVMGLFGIALFAIFKWKKWV